MIMDELICAGGGDERVIKCNLNGMIIRRKQSARVNILFTNNGRDIVVRKRDLFICLAEKKRHLFSFSCYVTRHTVNSK